MREEGERSKSMQIHWFWGTEKRKDLNLKIHQKLVWSTSFRFTHKVSLQEFENFAALWVTISTTDLKLSRFPNQSNANPHTKALVKWRVLVSRHESYLLQSLLFYTICSDLKKILRTYKKERNITTISAAKKKAIVGTDSVITQKLELSNKEIKANKMRHDVSNMVE